MKRIRSPNLSDTDKTRLIELCAKYKSVLENKRTNGVTQKQKNDSMKD